MPNDGLVYIVRLDSSLSTLNYNYVRPESTVTATGVRAHVTFKFEPQVIQTGSAIALGSSILFGMLVIGGFFWERKKGQQGA